MIKRRLVGAVLSLSMLLMLSACAPMTGNPSMALMTRDLPAGSKNLELIGGEVKESDSMLWILIFCVTGVQPTHEGVVDRLLDKYDADVLLNAELSNSSFGIPYIFMRMSATAKGQPARYTKGGSR
jgi:hypothetical protein